MSLCVDDSRKLLVKLVGTERVLDRQQLTTCFRSILMTKVKTYIAQAMRANAINIFEIDESLETFSADIQKRLIPDFLDYGVQLKRLYVTTVVKPDGDPQYEKFKELHFRQYADIAEAKLKQQNRYDPSTDRSTESWLLILRRRQPSVCRKDIPTNRSVVRCGTGCCPK